MPDSIDAGQDCMLFDALGLMAQAADRYWLANEFFSVDII